MNRENVKSIEEAPSGFYLMEDGAAVAKFGGGLQLSLSWSRDVSKRSIACLHINELQEKLKLCETIPEGAKVKEPSMVLCFDDVRSVDLVIDALQRIKNALNE